MAQREVIDRLNRGEAVDPASYYFRTTPYFETSSEKYAWLNRICSIATGSPADLRCVSGAVEECRRPTSAFIADGFNGHRLYLPI
jgi:hypothetical protein